MTKLYDHPAVSYACFKPRPGPTLPLTPQGRPVDLTLEDGTQLGGYLLCRYSGAPTLLVLHGVDETVADQLAYWPAWAEEVGANVFMVDWPGYASSAGTPSFSTCRATAGAALTYLLDQNEAEVPSVVVLGRGLGAVLAIDLFAEGTPGRVNGLVLEGGLTDVADWVADRVPWDQTEFKPEEVMAELDEALFRDFRTQEVLGALAVPVLVVHGILDGQIPVENAHTLAEWADTRRLLLLERGEGESLPQLNAPDYQRELKAFLEEVAPRERV